MDQEVLVLNPHFAEISVAVEDQDETNGALRRLSFATDATHNTAFFRYQCN